MTNYTKNHDYSDKDALAEGDPNKTILGADIDEELDELQTVIATKFDIDDIATQAQAEAGVSNDTLITPLRMGQFLSGGGGGSGALADILALADPGADRILFWDESSNAVDWLQVSTGLSIAGTVLTTNDAQIVHDNLSGFVANEHIDHSGVSITTAAGSGLTGGGTIAATRTLSLDIAGLTTDDTVDTAVDYIPYYDAGEAANNKVLMSVLVGVELGDGNWYRSTAQAIAANTATAIVFDTAVYDVLERGTYSTSTGIYTAGASGARIQASVTMAVATLNAGQEQTVIAFTQSTTERARSKHRSQGGTVTFPTVSLTVTISLSAGQTFNMSAYLSNAGSLAASSTSGAYNTLSIVELG